MRSAEGEDGGGGGCWRCRSGRPEGVLWHVDVDGVDYYRWSVVSVLVVGVIIAGALAYVLTASDSRRLRRGWGAFGERRMHHLEARCPWLRWLFG